MRWRRERLNKRDLPQSSRRSGRVWLTDSDLQIPGLVVLSMMAPPSDRVSLCSPGPWALLLLALPPDFWDCKCVLLPRDPVAPLVQIWWWYTSSFIFMWMNWKGPRVLQSTGRSIPCCLRKLMSSLTSFLPILVPCPWGLALVLSLAEHNWMFTRQKVCLDI